MTYKESIIVAIEDLKDRNGSSMISVKKYMQAGMPKDKKWQKATFLTALKNMVTKGDLTQIKYSYKLSPAFKKAKIDASKPKKVAPKKKKPAAPKKKSTAAKKKKTAPKKSAPKKKKTASKKKSAPKKKTSKKVAPKKKSATKKKQ